MLRSNQASSMRCYGSIWKALIHRLRTREDLPMAYGSAHLILARARELINNVPELLEPDKAAGALAAPMVAASDPYQALKHLGFAAPHMPGLPYYAHLRFVDAIAPRLHLAEAQLQLLHWLKPERMLALQQGASVAINALLRPWTLRTSEIETQSRLCHAIVPAYGDPRVTRNAVWSAVEPDLAAIMRRWLSREDMHFFCKVITETRDHPHWKPRHDFWLAKFRRGDIQEAWVAFGPSALSYVRHTYPDRLGTRPGERFASQTNKSEDKSLLIMQIGSRIVVDGCNNYKTHIFKNSDPQAPKLYLPTYSCSDIRYHSENSKAHNSIPSWQDWVERST
jgi:EH_Signature domain